MNIDILGISVLWIFLWGYIIVASIDFGAGFFGFYSVATGKKHITYAIIERYLSPVWEVTNVFLVFFYIGMVGFFPDTAMYYGTALLVPGSLALILLSIRGAYYAFSNYGSKQNVWYMFLYGATGLLIPAALSTVLVISEGGIIQVIEGKIVLLWSELFSSLYTWSVILLALVSVLYISAMFLTYYAHKAKDKPAYMILRGYALFWSLPTILASLFAFYAISQHNKEHFNNMLSLSWMFIASFICFAIAVFFVWKGRNLGLSFIMVMLQFGFAFFGYGRAHLPYILYPYITIREHFTNETMAIALVAAFIAGLFVLIPSIVLLLRLFLFDAAYVRGTKNKKGGKGSYGK
ncbi:cytochrome d ubiquinol oxidase subunit II [Paenibacillus albiflavus]|uniref:Cytochrome d ubiquinol oxidase subunit II n=1 Tax=Paenibacillus albiflavus TaxID=2545760 RepID=A0A4R4EC09_9BACL|nr:cytochrome d ubiquinol oxidase subunit II [Paenibacillus albiflavus]TCZ77219.1 cytochrome d ubiquinol oxidase subunit II [Paenibacillus albiflavus]